MTDNVNSPKHYILKPGLEVKDVREAILSKLQTEGIVVPYVDIDDWSRAWEYLTRCFFKNGAEDIEKAQYYINRMVQRIEDRSEFNLDNHDRMV
jgi:hypothetical protein